MLRHFERSLLFLSVDFSLIFPRSQQEHWATRNIAKKNETGNQVSRQSWIFLYVVFVTQETNQVGCRCPGKGTKQSKDSNGDSLKLWREKSIDSGMGRTVPHLSGQVGAEKTCHAHPEIDLQSVCYKDEYCWCKGPKAAYLSFDSWIATFIFISDISSNVWWRQASNYHNKCIGDWEVCFFVWIFILEERRWPKSDRKPAEKAKCRCSDEVYETFVLHYELKLIIIYLKCTYNKFFFER